jgi:hypothetical protein
MSGVEYFSWIVLCLLGLALLVYGVVRLVRWLRRPKDRPVREIKNVRNGRYGV